MVATPLGNLRDLTARARDILAQADLIAAEDTRVTAVLLAHCGIVTRPMALHEHNEQRARAQLLAALAAGRSVALVSDAGTPAVSDPGARLVRAARDGGRTGRPDPGAVGADGGGVGRRARRRRGSCSSASCPSAGQGAARSCSSALGALPCRAGVLRGAASRARDRRPRSRRALVGARTLVVARELTKSSRRSTAMPLADAPAWFAADANRERGEFVLLVDAASGATPRRRCRPTPTAWLAALLRELPPRRGRASRRPRDRAAARRTLRAGGGAEERAG